MTTILLQSLTDSTLLNATMATIVGLIVFVAIILLLREVVCWYYKLNKIKNLLSQQIEQNRQIIEKLSEISNKLEKRDKQA